MKESRETWAKREIGAYPVLLVSPANQAHRVQKEVKGLVVRQEPLDRRVIKEKLALQVFLAILEALETKEIKDSKEVTAYLEQKGSGVEMVPLENEVKPVRGASEESEDAEEAKAFLEARVILVNQAHRDLLDLQVKMDQRV